ncbi:hypothetical protein ACFFVB_11900 [Formosa undariae]|uniref:Uncharacterized protein n=1 Tax=Formosa undariae TaxID=1325436 RepID=A0ABV5F319_9FLAO
MEVSVETIDVCKSRRTYVAPNESLNFKSAYSLALVNDTVLNVIDRYVFNGFSILRIRLVGAHVINLFWKTNV